MSVLLSMLLFRKRFRFYAKGGELSKRAQPDFEAAQADLQRPFLPYVLWADN